MSQPTPTPPPVPPANPPQVLPPAQAWPPPPLPPRPWWVQPFDLVWGYHGDRHGGLERLEGSLAWAQHLFITKVLLLGHGIIPLLVMYVVVQAVVSVPNFENIATLPVLGPSIKEFGLNHPWGLLTAKLALAFATSLFLVIPNLIEAKQRHDEQAKKADDLKKEQQEELQKALVGLVTKLKRPPNHSQVSRRGVGCTGDVRANVCLVRRRHVRRFLEHFVSSQVGVHADRNIRFKLNEGLAGFAYSNVGQLLAQPHSVALPLVRKANQRKFTPGTEVVAARAIAFTTGDPACPRFNQVVGVLILTSDDPQDGARLLSQQGRTIIQLSIAGLFDPLSKLRRAYDGY